MPLSDALTEARHAKVLAGLCFELSIQTDPHRIRVFVLHLISRGVRVFYHKDLL